MIRIVYSWFNHPPTKAMSKPLDKSLCGECGAACCRYVALQIDVPTCKRDYDNIRWYLLHRGVRVFVDHAGDWYVEFESECTALASGHRCARYEDRPQICREHGEDGSACEFMPGGEPYKVRFSAIEEFERYLDEHGVEWRWKRRPRPGQSR